MRRATPTEILVPFVVFMVGCSAMTTVAYYYPDSPGYITDGILVLTIVALTVAAFFLDRARKKAT